MFNMINPLGLLSSKLAITTERMFMFLEIKVTLDEVIYFMKRSEELITVPCFLLIIF